MVGNGKTVSLLKNRLSFQRLRLLTIIQRHWASNCLRERFLRDFADSNAVILNEAAVKRMGLKDPVEKC